MLLPIRIFRWLTFCFAICGASMVAAAPEPHPSLELLRVEYLQSASAIRTLQYEFEIHWEALQSLPETMVPASVDPTVLTTGDYFQDGSRIAIRSDSESRSGAHRDQSWTGFDGLNYAHWRHSLAAPPAQVQLPQGRISKDPVGDLQVLSLPNLLGTHVFPHDSLERLLELPASQIVGREVVDGVDCIKVELSPYAAYEKNPDHPLQIIAWFDPAHGYLPRRMRTVDPVKAGELRWELTTNSFQMVKVEGASGHWVPVSGAISNGVTVRHLVARQVQINQKIPVERFRPDFPFGTIVDDDVKGNRFYAGGKEGAAHYAALSAARTVAIDAQGVAAAAAKAQSTTRYWSLFLGLFVVCIAGLITVLRRRVS